MHEFISLAIIFSVVLVLFYLLWINGYIVLNMKQAVLFIGSIRVKNKCKITFSSCSGYVKIVIKFKENRTYFFDLNCDVSKGDVSIVIENKNRETLLNLTPLTKTGSLTVDKKNRYYLILKFEKADGQYELKWH